MVVEWIPVIAIGGGIVYLFYSATRGNATKGSIISRVWLRHPKYFNKNKWTMGRTQGGEFGIESQDAEHCRIRYRPALIFWVNRVDEDIPKNKVHFIRPPFTKIPEGIVYIEPYDDNALYDNEVEKWRATVTNKLEKKVKLLERFNAMLNNELTKKDMTVIAQDNLKQTVKLVGELKNIVEGVKERTKEEIIIPTERKEEKPKTITS